MGFLIDTNLWIAVERGRLKPSDLHAITQQMPVYLSPVNLAEIQFGIDLMLDIKHRQQALRMLRRMRRKPLLRITGETGEVFGSLAAQLQKSGRSSDFRIQDLWLAAQTEQRGFVLLTANVKDFADIPGLKFQVVNIT